MRNIFFIIMILIAQTTTVVGQTVAPNVTLETPHNTIYSHLFYLQPSSYAPQKAAQCFYQPSTSGAKAAELAVQIKQLLDGEGLYVSLTTLPKNPNYQDTFGNHKYVLFPREFPEIYVEKIEGKWYYSPQTAELVPMLHRKMYPFGSDLLLKLAPRWATGVYVGLAIWQWLGLAFMLIAGFFVHRFLSFFMRHALHALAASRLKNYLLDVKIIRKIAHFLALILSIEVLRLFIPFLQLPVGISRFAHQTFDVASCIFLTLLALHLANFIVSYLHSMAKGTKNKMDDQMVPLLRHLLNVVISIIGIIYILNSLNVNVAALIAGISIGGLAIALAAQDSVKNLIGSFMIFIDRPFYVGDTIKMENGVLGTVEEVGFRTTRLRTPDTSLVSVPNGKLADQTIDNLGARVHRRFRTLMTISSDTPPQRIEDFLASIRLLLESDKLVIAKKTEVHLFDFSESGGLDVQIQVHFNLEDSTSEFGFRHDLLLGIVRLADENSIKIISKK